jgi:hypothetical protein
MLVLLGVLIPMIIIFPLFAIGILLRGGAARSTFYALPKKEWVRSLSDGERMTANFYIRSLPFSSFSSSLIVGKVKWLITSSIVEG